MRALGFALALGIGVVAYMPAAHAMDACDSAMATLKRQMHESSNSSIASTIQKAIDDAHVASAKGDQAACMDAAHKGLSAIPVVADKWMACHGGIVAMHRAGRDAAIMSVIEAHLHSAEASEQSGDVDSCLNAVHAGLGKAPTEGKAMDACTEGRAKLARTASSGAISGVIQSAIDGSGAQLAAGDMVACNETVAKALTQK
jgi:hypothetical protein